MPQSSYPVNAVVGETLREMVEEKQVEIEVPEAPLGTTAHMPVSINGHKLMAHYDGGSEINALKSSFVTKCGLAVDLLAVSTDGKNRVHYVEVIDLSCCN
jgi:hypothetical protein